MMLKRKRKVLGSLLGASALGLCLFPLVVTGIRRGQAEQIGDGKPYFLPEQGKFVIRNISEFWGDIRDLNDYIGLARRNAFRDVANSGKKDLLSRDGTQEDLDAIADEALPYIERTLSSIGVDRIKKPKIKFVDKFLGIYPVKMNNFLSGNYIGGVSNPISHQIEINSINPYTLKKNNKNNNTEIKGLLIRDLKRDIPHELIHAQYPGLPFHLWHKIPLFADESFVTVATLETLADQALHGDTIAKVILLERLEESMHFLLYEQENPGKPIKGAKSYRVDPIKAIISALNGHRKDYKGLSIDRVVEFLNSEISEVDTKYHGFTGQRSLDKYCRGFNPEVECLGPIKDREIIPDNEHSDNPKIRVHHQIDNITAYNYRMIKNRYDDYGVANLLPVKIVIDESLSKIFPRPLLVLRDVFGKIITVRMPEKQGQYLIKKSKSDIMTAIPYEGNFYETLKNIKRNKG